MLILTGPGRSGTSMLARIYSELGFSVGERTAWNEEADAGMESEEVVLLNRAIARDLGVSVPGRAIRARPRGRAVSALKKRAPTMVRVLQRAYDLGPGRGVGGFNGLRWDSVEDVARKYRGRLEQAANSHDVAKDPAFCWTMPVWLASECHISGAVVCVRDLNAVARSRERAGLNNFRSRAAALNTYVFGTGCAIATLTASGVDWQLVNYPEVTWEHPESIYRRLPLVSQVTLDCFEEVWGRVVRSREADDV